MHIQKTDVSSKKTPVFFNFIKTLLLFSLLLVLLSQRY